MEYSQRKNPRLKGYDYSEKRAYFITICTKGKRCILSEITDDGTEKQTRLNPYGEIADNYLRSVPGLAKYVIMPNHLHLLIENVGGESIPQLVRSFKTMVTKNIGEPIFQRSYHDHIIRDEKDYLSIWNYIDGNPQKWDKDCFFVK